VKLQLQAPPPGPLQAEGSARRPLWRWRIGIGGTAAYSGVGRCAIPNVCSRKRTHGASPCGRDRRQLNWRG